MSSIRQLELLIRKIPREVPDWTATECVEWGGEVINVERRARSPQKVAYMLFHGEFPKQQTFRRCGNKRCVNPHHVLLKDIERARAS